MIATTLMTSSLEKTIQRLGYAGLIPFVLLSLLMWLVHVELLPFVSIALAAYAAAIASFLGGIHWGLGFMKGEASPRFHFLWGVFRPCSPGWR